MTRATIRKARKNKAYALQIKRASAVRYVDLLRRFLTQIEADSVMVDQDNNILIDINEDKVKKRVARLQEPYHAIVNLDMLTEIFEQVCIITLDDGLEMIHELCADFRRKILKRLEVGVDIERSGLAQAWDLARVMEDVFTYSPSANVNLVKTTLNALIRKHEAEGKEFPTHEEFREWLKTYKKAA